MRKLDSWQRTMAECFIWTAQAVADLHAAIRDAGFEGKPLVLANVPEVAALFLKSPVAEGCNERGGARVLPAFVLIPVPFSPSLALLSVALIAPPMPQTHAARFFSATIPLLLLSLPFAPVQLWSTS